MTELVFELKGRYKMAAKPTMLTAEGLKNLEAELADLLNVKRKEIAEKINLIQ